MKVRDQDQILTFHQLQLSSNIITFVDVTETIEVKITIWYIYTCTFNLTIIIVIYYTIIFLFEQCLIATH